MKRCLLLGLLSVTGMIAFADAGFSIRRQHATVFFSFSGLENLQGYKLIQTNVGYYVSDNDTRPYAHLGKIISNDNNTITIQEGGRRWEESDRNIYLNLVDSLTGKTVDSFKYYAKDYSMHFTITGVKDGKLQFRTDKTKAVYRYLLMNEEEDTTAAYRRNRLIFIACSALGFLLLAWMFIRRKKKDMLSRV